MYLSKFSKVRVMEICHHIDGGVDSPHRFVEEILLNEHMEVVDMEVTAMLSSHPGGGD